jgi:hypothetical protein
MTYHKLIETLEKNGITRSSMTCGVNDCAAGWKLRIYVPKSYMRPVEAWLSVVKPADISVEVLKLPWWKNRFPRHKHSYCNINLFA